MPPGSCCRARTSSSRSARRATCGCCATSLRTAGCRAAGTWTATPAWRTVSKAVDLDRMCSFHYAATVQNDNTVRLAGHVFDIPPGPRERSYARARAEVRQLLDGTWRIYVNDALVATAARTDLG